MSSIITNTDYSLDDPKFLIIVGVVGIVGFLLFLWTSLCTNQPATPPPAAAPPAAPPATNEGIEMTMLNMLPQFTYGSSGGENFDDCAICLAQYVSGDQLRVLTPCSHGFHVDYVDTWLELHSTCPLCRGEITVDASIAEQQTLG